MDTTTHALQHNVRKKSIKSLKSLAEEITEEHVALGVFRVRDDYELLNKLDELIELIEENYPFVE